MMDLSHLIWQEPWLAPVVLNITRVLETTTIPTIGVTPDGRTIVVNPQFWKKLSPAERLGVQLHEMLHIVSRHAARRAHREPARWNIACDIAINAQITAAGYTLPADVWPGRDEAAEIIYDELAPLADLDVPGCGACSFWQGRSHAGQAAERPLAGDLLPRNSDGSTGTESAEMEAACASAAQLVGRGHSPLAKQFRPAPARVDWRVVLQRLVESVLGGDRMDYLDYGFDEWGICEDLLLPKPRRRLCALVDESGSISDALYEQFLGELARMGRHAAVCVSGFTDGTPLQAVPLAKYQRTMSGGTDVRRAYAEACALDVDAIIVLTDGRLDLPEKEPVPTIWAMLERRGRKWEVTL